LEVLLLWTKNCRATLASLAELLRSDTWDELAEVAHSIKGSSIQVGAKTVSSMAAELEKGAKSKKSAREAEAMIAKLRKAFEETTKKVEKWIISDKSAI
jgi:HPt (histidine-containing phosphotransfer) domain-containing protein